MSAREHIHDLTAFLVVARERSFTRAAAQLGLSQSRLSQTVRSLEERLGVRLLARTTRAVAPTEAGEHLLRTVAPRLDEIEAELAGLNAFGAKPAGTVRIAATEHAAASVLWPKLQRALANYPEVRIEVVIDYGLTDIVGEGIDAGIRPGGLVAKGMIAVPIGGDLRMAVVGSPGYFERHGTRETLQELTTHSCINLRLPTHGGLYAWEFEQGGRDLRVRVEGQLVVGTAAAALSAVLAGLGLAYLPEDTVDDHIAGGTLVRVLADFCAPFAGYNLYYPSRRQHSAAFGAVVEMLRRGDRGEHAGAAAAPRPAPPTAAERSPGGASAGSVPRRGRAAGA